MVKPTPNTLLVTHRGCLDGTGSAYVFVQMGGKRRNILFKGPNQCDLTPEEAAPYDEVWFVDLCPSMADPAGGKPFRVFDHHVSNAKKFPDDPRYTFDISKSGTSLLAHVTGYVGSNPHELDADRTSLIMALEAYDLGKFDYPPGMRLADVAASFSQDAMLDLMLGMSAYAILRNQDMTSRAEALAASRVLYAQTAAKSAYLVEVWSPSDKRSVLAAVAASPVVWKNETAQEILRRKYTVSGPLSLEFGKGDREVDVAIIVDATGGMVSFRSRSGGPDCSMMAVEYGGGGHARAAGFSVRSGFMLRALAKEVLG